MTVYGFEHGLKPCPFCNQHLVEAEAFRTRLTRTFVHDSETECIAASIRVLIGDYRGQRGNVEKWNRRWADSRWPSPDVPNDPNHPM